ncbi:mechanosensitive ion channel family protein [Roseateles saccharophilus]|uniref:Mechanosensitive ion channel-like protein n=1 Tax=Roseateles saccharophilus TaxID=304 RepID=A0A4R3VK18_ROSSA|nr:mechanosensitive ion channel domain-containing protein [Roseateles saccharophilus]MDG0834780.1 mechanosensitive ion channel [Roseateles saccharophilus]TCV03375.1 mechanosensitive ion channel-like protein [Roseateles saccharophilus]
MHQPLSLNELQALLSRAFSVAALGEWMLLLACLLLAGLVSTVLSRATERRHLSVLFGRRIIDGALFPLLALAFALAARRLLPLWDLPPALFRLALPLLVSLAAIRLVARVLAAAWPDSTFIKGVERLGSWLVWIGAVLWITGLWPMMMDVLDDIGWKVGNVHLTLRNMIEGGLTAALVLVLALWASSAIEAQLLRRESLDLSMRKIAANAIRALLLFIGLLFALSAAGIDLTALGVLGGALGVGLGFGLQKLAANYVSGFVILAERSLRIGDMVKVDGFEGRVTDIKTRYTVIRSLGGKEAIVPNENLITQRVENSSLADPRVLLSTIVQVSYDCDVEAVIAALVAATKDVPRVLADPGPSAQLSQFAADGLELTIYFWIADPENGSGGVRSEVNLAILRTLKRLGVDIPYPQRVLHQAGLPATQIS